MKKIFMLFAAAMMAFSLSAAELNIYASGLKAGAVNDEFKAEITYVLNAPATALEVQLLIGDEVKATIPVTDAALLTKGAHTTTIDLSEVANGTYNWAVKATGAAFEGTEPVKVGTAGEAGDMTRGITVDKNPESPFYGNVYTVNGKGQGVYAFDATLTPLFEGKAIATTGWGTGNASPFNANVAADGKVFINDWSDATPNIRIFDPANPTADIKEVFGGTASGSEGLMVNADGDVLHGSMSWCYPVGAGENTILYYSDEDVKDEESLAIFKVKVGEAATPITTKPEMVQKVGKFGIANGCYSIIPSKVGGYWVAQHRWQEAAANPSLIHIAGDTVNYSSMTGARVSGAGKGDNSRGILAVNADQSILVAGNSTNFIVFDVTWTNDVPTLTEKYIFAHGLTNAYAVAFDEAGNVYSIGQNTPLTVWALPTATNSVVTPAPKAQTLVVNKVVPAKITYELNGGVISDYVTAQDMYADLNADYNAATGATATWEPLDELTQGSDAAAGIPTSVGAWDMDFFNNNAKWTWLQTYMDAQCADQGKTLPSTSSAFMRYNLSSFFVNGVRPGWPASADYTTLGVGTPAAYVAYWKSNFANPANPEAEVTLNNPYKEGFTFDGWYATADFSGDKVTKVDATTEGTLYAKWIEYIPTIAEVNAMEAGVETKTAGVVTYVRSSNAYIQDATGATLLYLAKGVTAPEVGKQVVVSGKTAVYGGAPELASATIVSAEDGELPAARTLLLSDLMAEPLKYFGQKVQVLGLKLTSYDDKGNAYVTDGVDTVQCYYMTPDQAAIPVNSRVNIDALAGYYNKFQFVGPTAGITLAPVAGKDPATYAQVEIEGVHYNFTNNWLYSQKLENFAANKPNETAEGCRAMVVKDGIMYFPFCSAGTHSGPNYLVRYDAATGEKLDNIAIADSVFKNGDSFVFHPFSDMKLDNAGNAVAMNLPATGKEFQIWVVDLQTGAGELLVNACDSASYLATAFPDDGTIRLDRLGVFGDVKGDALIMSVSNSSNYVYYWNIVDGKWDGEHNHIACDISVVENGEAVNIFGDASFIQPISEELFYVDGFKTYAYLIDMDGNVVDYFDEEHEANSLVLGSNGKSRATGHNGVFEFELAGEYFLITAGDNTVGGGGAPSTFVMYQCKDENRKYSEMTQLWEFPAAGMGETSNPQRVAVPYGVKATDQSFTIYAFTAENGFGSYTFTTDKEIVGVENINDNNVDVQKVVENGQVYIIKNGVKYTVLGAEVK